MYNILICDDDRDIVSALDIYLTSDGYKTYHAYDGLEALKIVEEREIHLILMDVMMPRMDGFTTCRLMRERGITCPVIFLSAKGDIVDKGVGFQAGGDDYMVKPFDPRELLMHIEAHAVAHPALAAVVGVHAL